MKNQANLMPPSLKMDVRHLPRTDTAAGLYLLASGIVLISRGVGRWWKNALRGLQNEVVWFWYARIQYNTDQAIGAWLSSFYLLVFVIVALRIIFNI